MASKERSVNYWQFANKREGFYKENFWDMSTILKTKEYSIKESEANRKRVKLGDVVYMRIYSGCYIGRFVIGGSWKSLPAGKQKYKHKSGTFTMKDILIWSRPVPQNLIIGDLSNQNHRHRIVSLTHDDAVKIETTQKIYERLGFGGADGEIVILEKGLEEAIKPNLKKLGLKLATKDIQQQFSMGIGVGRSDLICTDENDDLIILELKRGMTSDQTIGQVLRYVGWVKENIAKDNQKVKGWVVAGDYDEQLRLAASAASVKLLLVRLG